jgi:hypothetical protein
MLAPRKMGEAVGHSGTLSLLNISETFRRAHSCAVSASIMVRTQGVQRTGFLQSVFYGFFNTQEMICIGDNVVFYGFFQL